MPEAVLAAVVAAAVSGLAAVLSLAGAILAVRGEIRKLEREQTRRLTEKLYDKRLACYPKAYALSDRLRGEYLLHGDASQEKLLSIRNELIEWHRTEAGFILSQSALKAWYQLRDSLAKEPEEDGGTYSKAQLKQIWKAKNQFRGALRADIGLLYQEERPTHRHARDSGDYVT